MSTSFPSNLDNFINPTSTDQVASVTVPHAEQHANANDAIEALEAKVGANDSAVTTSHDYKLSGVTGSDKASSLAGSEILSNKTLTAPKLTNGGFIADANGNELIEATTTANATNHIGTTNAATGNDPLIEAKGSDTDISLKIKAKGTGKVKLGSAELQFPNADGVAGAVLSTNGSGILSFAAAQGIISSIDVNTTGTYSLTTIANQRVLVFARLAKGGSGTLNATLAYNGVTKDSFSSAGFNASDNPPGFLMYTEVPGAGTANITLTGGNQYLMIIIKF